jgi:hypothetical protein
MSMDSSYSTALTTDDGVDVTMIRWCLSLTPAERLDFLQAQVAAILEIRELNARA